MDIYRSFPAIFLVWPAFMARQATQCSSESDIRLSFPLWMSFSSQSVSGISFSKWKRAEACLLSSNGLSPWFRGPQLTRVAAISAKVGSISDNHLGGWYAYRCSKAALNMLVKNLSVELPQ